MILVDMTFVYVAGLSWLAYIMGLYSGIDSLGVVVRRTKAYKGLVSFWG